MGLTATERSAQPRNVAELSKTLLRSIFDFNSVRVRSSDSIIYDCSKLPPWRTTFLHSSFTSRVSRDISSELHGRSDRDDHHEIAICENPEILRPGSTRERQALRDYPRACILSTAPRTPFRIKLARSARLPPSVALADLKGKNATVCESRNLTSRCAKLRRRDAA